jgi:hypothetical protein
MVLSHSRKEAVVWSRSMDQLAWHHVHNEAYLRLGGVAAVNRIDNLKTGANRQRIANLLPTARRLLFVVSDRQRIAYSRARPIRPLGFRDGSSAPSAV